MHFVIQWLSRASIVLLHVYSAVHGTQKGGIGLISTQKFLKVRSLLTKIAAMSTAILMAGCSSSTIAPKSDSDWDIYSPSNHLGSLFSNAFGPGSAFRTIRLIVTSVAVVAVALAGLKLVISDNPRDARVAKTWIISILAGLALFWIIPSIFSGSAMAKWFPQ